MKYIKESLFITTLLLSTAYSQCDANGDGELDVLDVVIEVDCILTDCWEGGSDTTDVCDIDGNCYETIQIGEQLWMAENLKVTHYNNGDEIPTGYSNSEWGDLEETETGAYAVYDDDPSNAEIYGNLYNWYATQDSRGLAPDGWHVPTDDEIKELEMYLGMSQEEADSWGWRGTDEGGKLKEAGTAHWASPNTGATNESGFTALPGGSRFYNDGIYQNMGGLGYFWSSSEDDSNYAWIRLLSYNFPGIHRGNYNKRSGFSVRCVKDDTETGTILVPYSSGWNIVGLPLDVEDASYSILFPESIEGTLYSFNGGYNLATIVTNGEGYWLRFNEEGSTTITGIPINELTISLNEDWNLISGISTSINISDIQDPDGLIIAGTVYGFALGGYSNAEILEPGKGYWVRANSSGNSILISE